MAREQESWMNKSLAGGLLELELQTSIRLNRSISSLQSCPKCSTQSKRGS